MATHNPHERSYKGVSRLEMEYFRLLASQRPELHGTYDILPEKNDKRNTFTIALSGKETDKLMQKVGEAAND